MKTLRYFAAIALVCVAAVISAEEKDVTTFLGIPVDGEKNEMRQKLLDKGFTPGYIGGEEILLGEFNGKKVYLLLMANNDNKVYAVSVTETDKYTMPQIIKRYNNLIMEFRQTGRYFERFENKFIPEDENIMYEMSVNGNKHYAFFYQKLKNDIETPSFNFTSSSDSILNLLDEYNKGVIDSLTYKRRAGEIVDKSKKEFDEWLKSMDDATNKFYTKPVHFGIADEMGKFQIILFYLNPYNQPVAKPAGEDL